MLYHAYIPVERTTTIALDKEVIACNKQTETNLVKRLERLKKKVMSNGMEVPVSITVGHSPVVKNMRRFAEENNIDLIVMGTRGASGLKKTIIGTVAGRVIEKSDIPVLLVPEKYDLKPLEQIVFATNYHKTDKQALTLVVAMAKFYNAAVTVLHLPGNYTSEKDKEKKQTDFDTYAYALQREFNKSKLQFHLLDTSSVTETMENLDKKFPYDMLAMVRRKKGFLEKFFIKSFTKNMAYTTSKPLLIVPEKE